MTSRPVDAILPHIQGIKPSGDSGHQWVGCCPAHEDAHQSLAIGISRDGVVLVKCYAGCEVEAILGSVGLSLGNLWPETEDVPAMKVTLGLLAWDKRLPEPFLRDTCRVIDNPKNPPGGVLIRYGSQDKKLIYEKRRSHLVAKHGSHIPSGQTVEMYGQWRLPRYREEGEKRLILVEGESDCWTLWYHGLPGFGLPGATGFGALRTDHLAGFEEIYIWKEPDRGGDSMAAGVVKRLAKLGWTGTTKIISAGPIKDPNDLHKRNPEGFKDAFSKIMTSGETPEQPTVADKKTRERKPRASVPVPGCVAEQAEAIRAGGPTPSPGYFGMTDMGNAQRIVFRHGQNLRYIYGWRRWLTWSGCIWTDKCEELVECWAKNTVQALYTEAADEPAADRKALLQEHAYRSESSRAIHAMIDLARSEPGIPMTPADLDADPWLLNCPNGTINLKTGELLPHSREHLMTKMSPTNYNAQATGKHWSAFIETIFGGNAALVAYVQRLMGYCLTANVSEQILPILWGSGQNGKSTLLGAISKVMGGDYAMAAPKNFIVTKKHEAHPTEQADLFGKRMVVCSETDQGAKLDEALVKSLTGGDPIRARRMRENMWEFLPTHKLMLCTNHRPQIKGTDHAIWRRVRLVPFTVTIPEAKKDKHLPDKLAAEAEAILAWCVRGCLDWQKQGLNPPPEVQAATSEYRAAEDLTAAFLADQCDTSNKEAKVKAGELYDCYTKWCEADGEEPAKQRVFGMALTDHGFERKREKGIRWWRGITIVNHKAGAPGAPCAPRTQDPLLIPQGDDTHENPNARSDNPFGRGSGSSVNGAHGAPGAPIQVYSNSGSTSKGGIFNLSDLDE